MPGPTVHKFNIFLKTRQCFIHSLPAKSICLYTPQSESRDLPRGTHPPRLLCAFHELHNDLIHPIKLRMRSPGRQVAAKAGFLLLLPRRRSCLAPSIGDGRSKPEEAGGPLLPYRKKYTMKKKKKKKNSLLCFVIGDDYPLIIHRAVSSATLTANPAKTHPDTCDSCM